MPTNTCTSDSDPYFLPLGDQAQDLSMAMVEVLLVGSDYYSKFKPTASLAQDIHSDTINPPLKPTTPPTQSHHTLPSPYQNPTPNPPSPLHLTNTSSPTPTTSNPLLPAPNASHAVGLVKNPDALSPQTPHVLPPELTTSIRPRC